MNPESKLEQQPEQDSQQDSQKKAVIAELAMVDAARLRKDYEDGRPLQVYDIRKDPNLERPFTVGDLDDDELLRIRLEYWQDREKLGRGFPDNPDEIKINAFPQPVWQVPLEDFLGNYIQQYSFWHARAIAKIETAVSEDQKIQIRNDLRRFYSMFLTSVCIQNDLENDRDIKELIDGHSVSIENVLIYIYDKIIEKFAEKEKNNIDERFVEPILLQYKQIDLRHGRNMQNMEEEFRLLMPKGVEVSSSHAAFYCRDPKTNLIYVIPVTNNTLLREWRDFFIAPKGQNHPIKEVIKAAVVVEQKGNQGKNSWAIIRKGELAQ